MTPTPTPDFLAAATNLADVLKSGELADEVATALTCTEVEALASFLEAAGMPEIAAVWRDAHAEGDDEGDDHYRGEDL